MKHRPTECDNCGMSLVSFSQDKLENGTCPFCMEEHTIEND